MKKKITLVILLLFLLPIVVQAQEPADFTTLIIKLWPEYDKPTMLVIYSIKLSPDVSLPAKVSIKIPASAGAPNAVASAEPDGTLINIPTYEQIPKGEWTELSFTTTSPDVWVEYYDPSLLIDGSSRHYDYSWPGDHSVEKLIIQVKQPFGATDLRMSPSLGSGSMGDDGLITYNSDVGKLVKGQIFNISLDYEKQNDQLSISNLPVESNKPIEPAYAANVNIKSALPWLIGFLGVALLFGGGFLYWQSGKSNNKAKPVRVRHKPASQRVTSTPTNPEKGFVYCHKCGKRAQPGDVYCRACGTQLRTGSE
jgi:hypothetical protein